MSNKLVTAFAATLAISAAGLGIATLAGADEGTSSPQKVRFENCEQAQKAADKWAQDNSGQGGSLDMTFKTKDGKTCTVKAKP